MNFLYLCDPEKNTECNKKSCFINGGPCNKTSNINFAAQPVGTVTAVLDTNESEDLLEVDNEGACN